MGSTAARCEIVSVAPELFSPFLRVANVDASGFADLCQRRTAASVDQPVECSTADRMRFAELPNGQKDSRKRGEGIHGYHQRLSVAKSDSPFGCGSSVRELGCAPGAQRPGYLAILHREAR
jgi:hypothetical protein